MESFYLFFFLRQIFVLLIFLSNIKADVKVLTMLFIDEFGGHLPFYDTKNYLNLTDRVIIMDTIGSMFCYFQVFVILLENNLLMKYHTLLLGVLLLHILSVLNYLKNKATDRKDKYIMPDLFKVVLLGCLLFEKVN
jgi:hypothetical protein